MPADPSFGVDVGHVIVHIADKSSFWLGLARVAMRAETFVISSIRVEVCADLGRRGGDRASVVIGVL
ncbi:hypothetical protein [Sorangium sp. So ce854]|uniref:Uncharacterized protein n=1 Tax=Sorangium cellulosum TaxID=56 RepID=A0A150PQ68_SORCE|nr:hypothetical protein BE08_18650 [Sorangium cellulosum]